MGTTIVDAIGRGCRASETGSDRGGRVGGLTAALVLARNGLPVTVLERDPLPPVPDAEAAFAAERRGAPQVHQTHGFLARLVVELRDRLPRRARRPPRRRLRHHAHHRPRSATRARATRTYGSSSSAAPPSSGCCAMRWPTTAAIVDPHRRRRSRAPRSTGPRPRTGRGHRRDRSDGRSWTADVVVAATGRRGPVGRLARRRWASPSTRPSHESGLMYLSRWYRFADGTEAELDPKLGGDLGFVKYLGGARRRRHAVDHPRHPHRRRRAAQRALRSPTASSMPAASCPDPTGSSGRYRLEPIGGVRPMTGLLNRIRRFVDDDGQPIVLGFHAVGDSHTVHQPALRPGLLARRGAGHPPRRRRRRSPRRPGRPGHGLRGTWPAEVEPWFEVSVQMDRHGCRPRRARPRRRRRDESHRTGPEATGGHGGALFAAAATDPIIGRGMSRFWNLLATPADLMTDPELMTRMAEVMADPDAYPLPPVEGPTARPSCSPPWPTMPQTTGRRLVTDPPCRHERPAAAHRDRRRRRPPPARSGHRGSRWSCSPTASPSWPTRGATSSPPSRQPATASSPPTSGATAGSSRPEAVEDYDILHLTGDLLGLLDELGRGQGHLRRPRLGIDGRLAARRCSTPTGSTASCGMSVPFVPRSSAPPIEMMRAMFADDVLLHRVLPGAGRGRRRAGPRPGPHHAAPAGRADRPPAS